MSVQKGCVVRERDRDLEQWEDAPRADLKWRTLISGDRTPTNSLTVGIVELQPGDREEPRWHSHAQAELYYILQGSGVVRIDGEEHLVETGAAVFVPGNAEHGARNTGTDVMRILYVFAADSFEDVKYVFRDPTVKSA